MMKSIMITGSPGFIGRDLIEELCLINRLNTYVQRKIVSEILNFILVKMI